MVRITLAAALLWLAACTQHAVNPQTAGVPPPPSLVADQPNQRPELDAFYRVCLRSGGVADTMAQTAEATGYRKATNIELASLKLPGLRKHTLTIPGGGAFISETQQILISTGAGERQVLVVEEQFARKRHIKTECSVYTPGSGHLGTCATLGYMLERAPASNNRYERQNAHFVEWHGEANGKPVRVACSGSDDSDETRFAGTRLSAKYIHATHDVTLGARIKRLTRKDAS